MSKGVEGARKVFDQIKKRVDDKMCDTFSAEEGRTRQSRIYEHDWLFIKEVLNTFFDKAETLQ